MVDDLRRELIQIIRHCDGIVLRQPEINKILNGKYKEVIEDFEKEPKDLDEIALAPAQEVPQSGLDPNENPVHSDDEDIESPSLSNYEPPIYEPPQST